MDGLVGNYKNSESLTAPAAGLQLPTARKRRRTCSLILAWDSTVLHSNNTHTAVHRGNNNSPVLLATSLASKTQSATCATKRVTIVTDFLKFPGKTS